MEFNYQTYLYITLGWICVGLLAFFYTLYSTAPYGRHTSKEWGPMISNKAGWFMMEITVLIVLYTFLCSYSWAGSVPVYIFIGLFTLHYLNRAIVFPLRIRTKGKKMPLMIAGSAMLFNLMNGALIGYYFTHFAHYELNWLYDPHFIAGTLLFLIGMIINWRADDKLIHLRKPGETGYKIPQGGLFHYISSPNLFGEILEWLGFAILTWSLPGFTFFFWTAANLIPRALAHHRWYKQTFEGYPTNRKALIPYIL